MAAPVTLNCCTQIAVVFLPWAEYSCSAEQVKDLSSKPYVARELMLIKVRCNASQRRELSDLADIFHGTVCDVSLTTITLELQGKEDKMHALQGLLEPYGESATVPNYKVATHNA